MALEITDGVQNVNPIPTNRRYYNSAGALYTSVAQAKSQIAAALRYKGLTVGVDDGSGNAVEYWWKNGTADGDLIAKTPDMIADAINYDNSLSTIAAGDVRNAIDELDTKAETNNSAINSLQSDQVTLTIYKVSNFGTP